jgi:hypothetical protein
MPNGEADQFLAGQESFHDQRSAIVIHGQQPGD